MRERELPRLAIIGDVAPERTTSGSLLLFRLFQEYPPDKIIVFYNSKQVEVSNDLKLPFVKYIPVAYKIPRLIWNRFNPSWPIGAAWYMKRGLSSLDQSLNEFRPEVILVVSQWFLWFAGLSASKKLKVPYVLVSYDDWAVSMLSHIRSIRLLNFLITRIYRSAYRRAITRLCISPGMAEQYNLMYDAKGTVLYPNRGCDSPTAKTRYLLRQISVPILAFCGVVHAHQIGMIELLRSAAAVLASLGGHLNLYTPSSHEDLNRVGLNLPGIKLIGFFTPLELANQVPETALGLLLPASFRKEERIDTSTLFPSKLADYTAIGIPIIIWGPQYSSAGRWGLENPEAAVVISENDPNLLTLCISKITDDPEYAGRLASGAVEAGNRYFTLDAAREILYNCLCSSLDLSK